MGEELVDSSPLSLRELFTKLCDYFVSIGLSYEDFWDGDPLKAHALYRAEKIKQQRENNSYWLLNLYTYEALARVSPLFNGFSKQTRAHPYLEEPLKPESKKKEVHNMKARFLKLVEAHNMQKRTDE